MPKKYPPRRADVGSAEALRVNPHIRLSRRGLLPFRLVGLLFLGELFPLVKQLLLVEAGVVQLIAFVAQQQMVAQHFGGADVVFQLDNARAEAEKFMAEARKQQAEILSDAQKMKTQIIDEAKVEASKEAQKVMDAAKVSIQQSQKEAELQLKNEVSKFALDIAEKVMRKEMKSDKAQSELVNKLLDEYENN